MSAARSSGPTRRAVGKSVSAGGLGAGSIRVQTDSASPASAGVSDGDAHYPAAASCTTPVDGRAFWGPAALEHASGTSVMLLNNAGTPMDAGGIYVAFAPRLKTQVCGVPARFSTAGPGTRRSSAPNRRDGQDAGARAILHGRHSETSQVRQMRVRAFVPGVLSYGRQSAER